MNSKNITMKPEEVKRLLEKYYDGESTLEEELVLKKYFSRNDVPEDLAEEKEIFGYYIQSVAIPEPSVSFEKRIISALDTVDHQSVNLKRRKIFGIITGIAAAIIMLAGSYFFFIQRSEPRDTYSDPEIAYAETMKILYNVSSRLNQGTRALDRIGSMQEVTIESLETINKSASGIIEKMKPLGNLNKAMNSFDNSDKKN